MHCHFMLSIFSLLEYTQYIVQYLLYFVRFHKLDLYMSIHRFCDLLHINKIYTYVLFYLNFIQLQVVYTQTSMAKNVGLSESTVETLSYLKVNKLQI